MENEASSSDTKGMQVSSFLSLSCSEWTAVKMYQARRMKFRRMHVRHLNIECIA